MTAGQIGRELWARVAAHDWPGLRALLDDDVVLDYPHTGERFVGADTVVRLNADYPEGWSISLVDVVSEGDRAVCEVEVPMDGVGIFAVASVLTVRDGLVVRIRDYWIQQVGDEPPAYRAHLAERYDGRVTS